MATTLTSGSASYSDQFYSGSGTWQPVTAVVVATATSSFNAANPYIYAIVGFMVTITNLSVVVVMATSKKLKKRFENNLILNQALIDMVTGLLLMLNQTATIPISQSGWFFQFLCRYWSSSTPLWCAAQASVTNLVIITLERYFEIVYPLSKCKLLLFT